MRVIEETRRKIENRNRQKEAVRIIEKYWILYLMKKDLMEKKRMWEKLPLDCRLLWTRFSQLKQQTYGLSEKIKDLNRKYD